jgi:hypothetical protein
MAGTSMSMSIATPTSITTSIETRPGRKCRKGDRSIKRVRANGSIIQNIAKAFHIATRGRHRNSTERAPTTRLNHASSFVAAPIKEDRISRAAE